MKTLTFAKSWRGLAKSAFLLAKQNLQLKHSLVFVCYLLQTEVEALLAQLVARFAGADHQVPCKPSKSERQTYFLFMWLQPLACDNHSLKIG